MVVSLSSHIFFVASWRWFWNTDDQMWWHMDSHAGIDFDQLIYKIYATPREVNRYTNMFHQTTQIFRVENESIRDQTPKCLSVGSGSKVKESSTLGCFSVITIIAGCLQLHLCPKKLYRQMNFWEYFFPQVWWTRLTSSSSQTDFFAAKEKITNIIFISVLRFISQKVFRR